MDREEIVELLESLSDTLSEMGTAIAEGDLAGLGKTLTEVGSDLGQVREYLQQQGDEEEEGKDD